MDLFGAPDSQTRRGKPTAGMPLAERVRPRVLDEFAGQSHLLGEGKPLRVLIEKDEVASMIFWGPPGVGKTTLAGLIAAHTKAAYFQLNAVAAGVADVRKVIATAEESSRKLGKRTILFIDEIHRFNKAQQDALLHSVEDGIITLIGATTENPSFEVISPLLSRCRVYVLEPLSVEELNGILDHAIAADESMRKYAPVIDGPARELLLLLSGGDARVLLNGIELASRITPPGPDGTRLITTARLEEAFQKRAAKYDKGGEEHYNIISAFIKSLRGSDPDGALYWMARMLEGGEDPKFIARRMLILASEDVGNADPQGLVIATSCFTAIDYVGMPEARIILAQAATYLASAPKSNASYIGIGQAIEDVRSKPFEPVPIHLRNAPTKFMKDLGYLSGYQYAHDYDGHFSEQQYLPDGLKDKIYYKPTDLGAEKGIRERLNRLWKNRQR